MFANVYMYPEKPGVTGRLKKFDVLTGKVVWDIPDPYPNWGGSMNTAGGLAFYGSLGGDFRAVDRDTGEVLWHRKLGSGIIGNPITYEVKGKQYVSVLSGIGGWNRSACHRRSRPERQVRCDRRDSDDQGRRPRVDPARRYGVYFPRLSISASSRDKIAPGPQFRAPLCMQGSVN